MTTKKCALDEWFGILKGDINKVREKFRKRREWFSEDCKKREISHNNQKAKLEQIAKKT